MYDLIIIGAGPAGLTAALYAGRYRLNTLVLEKMSVGGQIILSWKIENFPGFPGGISTQELIERMKKQVDELGVKIEMEEAAQMNASFKLKQPLYNIKTKENNYETKSVIVASGAEPKRLHAIGEKKFIGRGISYCATCDGPLFKNKEVCVIGGGDRAIEEALFLSSYAHKVNIIHRRDALRASKILEEKARADHKINFILDSVVEEVQGEDSVEAVKIKNIKNDTHAVMACQGVFIFVGIKPNTDFLNKQLETDESGFIITDENLNTSLEGVFACGDCRHRSLYQVITAAGEGAVAASSVQKYLL